MEQCTLTAFLYSLRKYINGKEQNNTADVTLLSWISNNEIYVKTKQGIICHAICNPFNGCIYADDVYAVVPPEKAQALGLC